MPPCGVFLVRIDRCIITIRITINRTRVVGRASQALLYALSIAAAFLFVSFDMGRDELLPGEGLLIDFGTTETGLGDRDLSATDVQAPPQQAAAEASRQQVEYVTSEREEIAVQTPQPEKKPASGRLRDKLRSAATRSSLPNNPAR